MTTQNSVCSQIPFLPTLSYGFSASTVCMSYPYAITYKGNRDTLMTLTGLCKLFVLLYFLLISPFCQKGHILKKLRFLQYQVLVICLSYGFRFLTSVIYIRLYDSMQNVNCTESRLDFIRLYLNHCKTQIYLT